MPHLKSLALAACFTLALLVCGQSPAQAKYAAFVVDADTGRILHAVNADTRNYPASLTKMMTLYMAFDNIKRGQWNMQTPLKVTARAARQPASKIGLRAGSTIRVRDAILSLIVKSANDVATVIAENHSGSERDFALRMTAKARTLGMKRTTFRNASGLPNRGQLSTARDMARLAKALMRDFPEFYDLFGRTSFAMKGKTYRSHNKLLKTYRGADGLKTGYIRASGFNLATSAKRGNKRLIGVVFGGRTAKARNKLMARLLDKGFEAVGTRDAFVSSTPPRKPDPNGDKVAAAPTTTTPTLTTEVSPVVTAKPTLTPPEKLDRSLIGTWGVQVGAYSRYNPAYEMARKAMEKVPDVLRSGRIKVEPLKKKNGKRLYRARIVGLGKREAQRACQQLEARKISCMELIVKDPMQVATNIRR
ncbi:MAG: D-alanyl-D-alanine carboxypeptidase [Magnetovibrionaceae bacterium]